MDKAILPLAITMMAGPQFIAAVLFVTGRNPIPASLAYVAAVAIATAGGVFIWWELAGLIGDGVNLRKSSEPTTAGKVIPIVLVGLLILLSIKTWLRRETAEPPKWLGKLQDATPLQAFVTGIALILLFPSDLAVEASTGFHLRSEGNSYSAALPFVALTIAIAALPIGFYLLFRKRAEVTMPKVRNWMNDNSWVVSIAANLIFILLILG